ncbi:hypothetical protein L210DRAFT_853584, partial [Boletus edulis BED1]
PCSFISGPIALHLRFHLVIGSMATSDIAEKYDLPDPHHALVQYLYSNHNDQPLMVGGRRYHCADDPPPFKQLQVWQKAHLQQRSYHNSTAVLSAQMLNASPPVTGWPKGRYDAAIVNVDDDMVWPHSGLKGLAVLLDQHR